MTMVKIQGNSVIMSAAGMPPTFIFRKETNSIEEHLIQGMPLGTLENFPYQVKDTTLQSGDTILMISDGLPELKNTNQEMFGYKGVRNTFEEVADNSPEEIIDHLKTQGSVWVGDKDPDDDVTFVVIKVKK
jgi:two-component system sensor histidine kinase ChiS